MGMPPNNEDRDRDPRGGLNKIQNAGVPHSIEPRPRIWEELLVSSKYQPQLSQNSAMTY